MRADRLLTESVVPGGAAPATKVSSPSGRAGKAEPAAKIDTIDSYLLVTGHPRRLNYWKAMRYFFHILHGPKVFPDVNGNRLSSPELAIRQAKALAAELSKAGEFCRLNSVLVLDENGNNIFGCRAA